VHRFLSLAILSAGVVGFFVFVRTSDTTHRAPVAIPVGEAKDAALKEVLPSARAAVVIEGDTGTILLEQDAFTPYPLASLTKIMSAMVVLDHHPDLDQRVTILPTEYTFRGGNLRLGPGETVTLRDLLFASIVGSANNAAFALPRVIGLSDDAFIDEMNRKAITLGLDTAHFFDTAGFDPRNIASAYDFARLADTAFSTYPLLAEAASAPEYLVTTSTGREHVMRHSNKLLASLGEGAESKTGYLDEALHCLVLTKHINGKRLLAVILGHADERGVITDARTLLQDALAPVAGTSATSALGVP
jgi:D-alanyl-D-alanine endopeptidase (penicillin-binding protein 7)